MLLNYSSNFLRFGRTLPYKKVFKMLFGMSIIILHRSEVLIRNMFRDLSFTQAKFQPTVAYKTVAYKKKSVYTVIFAGAGAFQCSTVRVLFSFGYACSK